jgi:hypothetical protein
MGFRFVRVIPFPERKGNLKTVEIIKPIPGLVNLWQNDALQMPGARGKK